MVDKVKNNYTQKGYEMNKKFNLVLDTDDYKKIKEIAFNSRLSVSALIRIMILEYLKTEPKKSDRNLSDV
jgi:hypothetical protein